MFLASECQVLKPLIWALWFKAVPLKTSHDSCFWWTSTQGVEKTSSWRWQDWMDLTLIMSRLVKAWHRVPLILCHWNTAWKVVPGGMHSQVSSHAMPMLLSNIIQATRKCTAFAGAASVSLCPSGEITVPKLDFGLDSWQMLTVCTTLWHCTDGKELRKQCECGMSG